MFGFEFLVGHLVEQRSIREESDVAVVLNQFVSSLRFLEGWLASVGVLLPDHIIPIKMHPWCFDEDVLKVSKGLIVFP